MKLVKFNQVKSSKFDLKELKQRDMDQPRPLNYRDGTLHYLPEESNTLQKRMTDVENFCKVQKMIINEDKTTTAMFNTATTKDSYHRIHNSNGTEYENVENFKFLGVTFDARLRMTSTVEE